MGFGTSRAQSRQLVRHGHVQVNGRRVDIPSFQAKPNDVIEIQSWSKKNPAVFARHRSHRALAQPQLAGSGSRESEGPRAGTTQARRPGADSVERAAHCRVVFEVGVRKTEEPQNVQRISKTKEASCEYGNTHRAVRYTFIAQPFERGFGSTIGTGLRRVLLSSIEGAAITAVRIDGVAHEFSPIPSVVEDATDIILNLKQVPFKMMGEGTRTVRLKATTPGPVLSGQIETDQDIEVLDRNMHIATIGPGGKLNIEMRLKSGRG